MSKPHPTICLNMIVKNESKIIKRLIDSVLPIIDTYCICDTGSTDNTIELINEYFKEKGIKGEVFTVPFKDFGFNRSASLDRAVKWGDYALLLDADMILEILPSFRKNELTHDVYQFKQKNSSLDYYNTRMVRTGRGIKCVGVTHEYYDVPSGLTSSHLNTLEINDVGDGGAKGDKYTRDIRLLRTGLLSDPKNVRYHFYLANSYRDNGSDLKDIKQQNKAIKWYKRRVALGGWDEELFISCLEIGHLYMKLNKPEEAIYWWIEAYLHRKTRAESLYEIIKYYREKSSKYTSIAGHFYKLAKDIPYPKDDSLFIKKAVYDYLLDYEGSILAYYNDWPVDQYKYLNLLGKHNDYNGVLSNFKFYVKRLKSLKPKNYFFNDVGVIPTHKDKFNPSTPSIIPYHGGYLMNQRYVNYFIEPNGSYTCNQPITTFNRRIKLNSDFKVTEKFDFDELPTVVDKYSGIEDVKIFQFGQKILFLGTEQDMETKNLTISGGVYGTEPVESQSHAMVSTLYSSPKGANCEKNWCYINHNGTLKLIYQWCPLITGQISGKQLVLDHPNHEVPAFFKHLRGSSNGFQVGDEIWLMTHMVEYSSPRNYYHCIVILDKETLKYKRHSILFKIDDSQIEYCLGIIVELDRIIIGYSKMDRETIVSVYNRQEMEKLIF